MSTGECLLALSASLRRYRAWMIDDKDRCSGEGSPAIMHVAGTICFNQADYCRELGKGYQPDVTLAALLTSLTN
jgi:hypothetical protein